MVASLATTPQGHRATLSPSAPKADVRASRHASSDTRDTVGQVAESARRRHPRAGSGASTCPTF